MNASARYRIGIAGGSGYGGAEALRWLAGHPHFDVCGVTSRSNAGRSVADVHPNLAGFHDNLSFVEGPPELLEANPDAVVMALPHRHAAAYAHTLRTVYPELRIVDLSGDHRLDDASIYRDHYHGDHPHPEELQSGDWIYGLPEANRERLSGARLVANPGCFATGALLAALPLTRRGLITGAVRHTAITGSSGSGVEPTRGTHHPERTADVKAYKVLAHQHVPELLRCLREHGLPAQAPWLMVPHSGPFARGIFTTLFVELPEPMSTADLHAIYVEDYGSEPFVRLREGTPRIGHVARTNFCDVAVHADGTHAVVLSTIDNLGKGMASQAIQNLNLLFDLAETAGLHMPGSRP